MSRAQSSLLKCASAKAATTTLARRWSRRWRSQRNQRRCSSCSAEVARLQGDLDAAEQHYQEALAADPSLVDVRQSAMFTRRRATRTPWRRLRPGAAGLRRRPGPWVAGALTKLGNSLTAAGEIDQAVARYREALAANPGYAGGASPACCAVRCPKRPGSGAGRLPGRRHGAARQCRTALSSGPGAAAQRRLSRSHRSDRAGSCADAELLGRCVSAWERSTRTPV